MDAEKTGNYQENIHRVDYRSAYENQLTGGDSLISGIFDGCESLDGMWNFGIDQYDTCLRAKWFEEEYRDGDGRALPVDFSFDTWERVNVPSCWNLQREKDFHYEGSVVYTRTFAYKSRGEKRAFLKFEGVNYHAFVFINGRQAGAHKGGSTPFFIEVTDFLREENRIVVVADNTRRRESVPCENTDWFNYGGIFRSVSLIRMPETFIRRFSIALRPDGCFDKLDVLIGTDGSVNEGSAVLEIEELGIAAEIKIADGAGRIEIAARPELWSPENPKLYNVRVRYLGGELREKVGFREIRTDGTEILLNGSPIFLRGVCTHEESVENGRSLTEAEIRQNLSLAREMGCNFMRLAHYPHHELTARIADEMGMLLWEEIPVYWAIKFSSKETYLDAENQLFELIGRDINRASVIIWSVGNENADTDERLSFMSALAGKAKELDPARLVSAACLVDHTQLVIADRLAEFVDVIGINEYYGWYEPDFSKLPRIFENSRPQKPVVITEFGADARCGSRGSADDMYTEDFQRSVYERQVAVLSEIKYVKGVCPWILYDFRCPRRLHCMQDGYNIKGLLSADKSRKKQAFSVMCDFYRSLSEK